MKTKIAAFAAAVWTLSGFAAPFAYVPNEGSGTLSVIDTATDSVVHEIKAGKKPRVVATGKAGNSLYVLLLRKAVCRTARRSVVLIFSPENMAVIFLSSSA